MDAEAVLKHRVRNEQTSGEKKLPSKGVLIYFFFPAHMQIFRLIGQSFGSRRERVKLDPEKNCTGIKDHYFQAETSWFHMIIHISHLQVVVRSVVDP